MKRDRTRGGHLTCVVICPPLDARARRRWTICRARKRSRPGICRHPVAVFLRFGLGVTAGGSAAWGRTPAVLCAVQEHRGDDRGGFLDARLVLGGHAGGGLEQLAEHESDPATEGPANADLPLHLAALLQRGPARLGESRAGPV